LGEGCLLLRGREGRKWEKGRNGMRRGREEEKGREGDRREGKGRGGRARNVCVPINKKNYHYTAGRPPNTAENKS